MHKNDTPLDREPAILFTEFNAPAIVFFIRDEAPSIIPNPPSKGPLINPSAGFVIRSVIPVEIF